MQKFDSIHYDSSSLLVMEFLTYFLLVFYFITRPSIHLPQPLHPSAQGCANYVI